MTIQHRPSKQLNKSLTILKVTFNETAQAYFSSSKIDNVLNTSLGNLDQKLALLQNQLGL